MAKQKKELPRRDISAFIGAGVSGKPLSKESAKQNSNQNEGKQASLSGGLHRSIYGSAPIRSAMLFVLISAAYVLIVIGSTTDMMLLREGEIILPFIQVGVPVVAFYIGAPLLILFLHLNLLGRLILLARDIYRQRGNDDIMRRDDKTPKVEGVFDMVLTLLFPTDPERLMSAMREAPHATAPYHPGSGSH